MDDMHPIVSFRWRLAWVLLVPLFATVVLFFLINYQIEKRILSSQIQQRGLLVGKALQLNLAKLLSNTETDDLSRLSEGEKGELREYMQNFSEENLPLDAYSQNEGVHDLFFIDAEGKVVLDNPADQEGRILPIQERISPGILAGLKKNDIVSSIQSRAKDSILFITFPLLHKNQVIGFGRIEMSMNSAVALLDRVKIWSLMTAGGVFLVGVLFSIYFAKSLTRPIGELVQAATRIGKGDFSRRLNENRRDEIGILMRAFNRMTEGVLKLEETQRRVKKLEAAGEFGARVAHEIKNPLNSIGLIIDHLRDNLAPVTPPEREKFMELSGNMKRELERLNRTVEGFLRSARPASLSRQVTDLNDLIEETAATIIPEANQQHVEIDRRLNRNLPKIALDYNEVRQALLNLILNALQAMPHGGAIHLSTFMNDHGNDEVAVSIRDTGQGIPPENLSRLFEPYFTTKVRGFGLGLSIVERIMQDHGGRIEVESEIGKGSVFTLLFPVKMETKNA